VSEDFNLGIFGTVSTPVAVDAIMESDCIIAFGASLNRFTLSRGTFAKNKRIVQINLEPTEVGKNIDVTVGLVGDPQAVADLIVRWLDEAEIGPSGYRTEDLKHKIAARAGNSHHNRNRLGSCGFSSGAPQTEQKSAGRPVIGHRRRAFHAESVDDNSRRRPRLFCNDQRLGSIGLGLSFAVGAAYASTASTDRF